MKAGKLLNTSRPPARSTINNPPPGCDFFPLPSLTSGKAGKLLNMVSGQDPLPEQLLPSVQPPLREAEAPEEEVSRMKDDWTHPTIPGEEVTG